MMYNKRLLKILYSPYVSEKASIIMKKNNTIVLKVAKNATKLEIKNAINFLFEVKIKFINTLIVKGKKKRHANRIGRRGDWKKAYITLKEGYSLDFIGNSESV
ncbi:50S ribosomal protein L23 [Candidatus Arsenophonus lipoptenae]|uniref:Large ribosomal subunit protein uL23 n=1 Tax=Candidatus Arsenophonus lipoptenae TaxID=634113 RepID=A0A0X9VM56_9GAMM|nr:50S ribosomal protein L23 [Candidatus Arsenophonus lipoptenae]AMA64776.1 50S ribosomal protein L23 [Candidatus Arsenophonus lipoptenae]